MIRQMLDVVRIEANNLAELNFEFKSKLESFVPNDLSIFEPNIKKDDLPNILFPIQKQINVNPSLELDTPKLKRSNSSNKDLFRDQEFILAEKSTDTYDLIQISVNECQTEEEAINKEEINDNSNDFNNYANKNDMSKRDSKIDIDKIIDSGQNIEICDEKNINRIRKFDNNERDISSREKILSLKKKSKSNLKLSFSIIKKSFF